MSIDTPSNHKHAAMLDDDDHPGWDRIPEVVAAERVVSAVGAHLDREPSVEQVAAKVVANRAAVRAIFDELDGDPRRLRERTVVLKQQTAADADAGDFWLEQLAYHLHAAEECRVVLRSMPVHRDLYEVDERGADEDDRRISRERQDEAARANAPRGIAS